MHPDLLKVLIVSKFPFPIACYFRRAIEAKESPENAFNLFHTTLEFLGQLLIADFLSWENRDPELNEEVSRILQKPLTAGIWLDWTCRILQEFGKQSRSPILGALQGMLERQTRKKLDRLLEWRNRWAHSGAVPQVGAFRKDLFSFLSRIQLIHRSTLFCPMSSRISGQLHIFNSTLLVGDNTGFGEVECRSNVPLETGQVHLYSNERRELLSLHPLVLFERCDQCGERHLFTFDRPHGHKIVFRSIPGGHEKSSGEYYLLLEQLLRRPLHPRLRPRHFSLPGDFAAVPRTLQPGDLVGPYRVDELIKIGGMAQIYRAMDTRSGKNFALKLLPVELSRDPVLLMRFEEEAQNLRKLNHPNVVPLHDYGEDFGDRYVILDLAIGGMIGSQRCRDLSELRKPLDEDLVIKIGKQVCEGLHHIHSHGIIHRDLKPGNLLLSGKRILITDFGISRARGENKITMTGLPVGTPEYMSPEQVQQDEVDSRTDIYSLGCVLYELATGRTPYRADTPLTTALYHLQAMPPQIEDLNPRISKGLVNIIYKSLQKKPDLRYQSARELFDDLTKAHEDPAGPQLLEGQKVPQDALEEIRARERKKYRRRLFASAFLSVLLTTAGLGIIYLFESFQVKRSIAEARSVWYDGPARRLESAPGGLALPEGWEEACARIHEAFRARPGLQAVKDFRKELASKGSLVISTDPQDVKIDVKSDEKGCQELAKSGLQFAPKVLNDKPFFQSGERIFLAPGPYKAGLVKNVHRFEIPIFIGFVSFQDLGGRWEPARLEPSKSPLFIEKPGEDSASFLAAETVFLDQLIVPEDPPPGLRYVNRGPFWCSDSEKQDFSEILETTPKSDVIHLFKMSRLLPNFLDTSFFMGETEVTVGEFKKWFDQFGEAWCEWMVDKDVQAILPLAEDVPFDILRDCWGKKLPPGGPDPSKFLSPLDLLNAIVQPYRTDWRSYKDRLKSTLAKETDERLPAGKVLILACMAYALTHAPIAAGEFKSWLTYTVKECGDALAGLGRLQYRFQESGGDDLKIEDLPPDLWLWHRGNCLTEFRWRSVLDAYFTGYENIPMGYYLAGHLPMKKAIGWARNHQDQLPSSIWKNLDALERDLGNSWQCLADRSEYQILVLAYGNAVMKGQAPIDKSHFLKWLAMKIREIQARHCKLKELLDRVSSMPAEEVVKDVPWDFRLEYGHDLGWGLPTVQQWEKALRGADDRPRPWGHSLNDSYFWNLSRDEPKPVDMTGAGIDFDSSPYGVRGLAGNVSEWVLSATGKFFHFLKGSNFRHQERCSNLGNIIAAPMLYHERWTGFRIIKTIRPPHRYEREFVRKKMVE
ncbi:MAG: protein kinase [Planctomycetes bacterium]|nr:protein kinase [Planctomycetota bacterium]